MLRDLFSLFPAYAGVIPLEGYSVDGVKPFPRIRGGDPNTAKTYANMEFFSPHTRG